LPGYASSSGPPSSTTGRITFGGSTLGVGDSAGSTLALASAEGDSTTAGLALVSTQGDSRALRRAVARRERRTKTEETRTVVENASEVMDKIEHALAIVNGVASGDLDLQALGDEADDLFGLLQRLNGARRWKDALRVARCLAVVAALIGRWIELLRSLRMALHAAEELGDPLGEAWALHELGTLHLVAGRHAEANRQLDRAREIRQQSGSRDIAATNANLQVLCQILRERAPRRASERMLDQLVRRPWLALIVATTLLVVGGAVGAVLAGGSGSSRRAKVAFSFVPSTPHVGQNIVFSASATDAHDPAASYTWQWGDGDPATKRVQRHEYHAAGTYRVVLTVRDARDRVIGTIARSVTIRRPTIEHGPNAYFSFQPHSPTAGTPVLFDASSSYDPLASIASYEWSFGDGESARGVTTSHSFAQSGTYTVSLTVTDTDGQRNTLAETVAVTAGAAKGKRQAAVALRCPADHSRLGEAVSVAGSITPPRPDTTVKAIYLTPSGKYIVRTTESEAHGYYHTTLTPQEAGSWSVQGSQAESSEYRAGTSEPCTFSVAKRREAVKETRTGINCPSTLVRPGEPVTVSGSITPAESDTTVTVLYTSASGEASPHTATRSEDGSYETSYTPPEEGAWTAQSSQAETGEYRASTSTTCKFTVEKRSPPIVKKPIPPPSE
jgi:PKD repeat protein